MTRDEIDATFAMLSALTLSLPRLLVCLVLVPAFSPSVLHGTLRTVVGLALALPVAYRLHAEWPAGSLGYSALGLLAAKEAALGLLIGTVMSLPFWVFQSLGTYLDNQRGANAMQLSNPSVAGEASALGALTVQAVTVLAFQTGAFSAMLAFLYQSYLAWPPLSGWPPLGPDHLSLWLDAFSDMVQAAVLYCAPPMIALLMVDLGFALLGLVAPQLQVYFAAMPIKSLVGLFILAVYAATLWQFAGVQFAGVGDFAARLWSLGP